MLDCVPGAALLVIAGFEGEFAVLVGFVEAAMGVSFGVATSAGEDNAVLAGVGDDWRDSLGVVGLFVPSSSAG